MLFSSYCYWCLIFVTVWFLLLLSPTTVWFLLLLTADCYCCYLFLLMVLILMFILWFYYCFLMSVFCCYCFCTIHFFLSGYANNIGLGSHQKSSPCSPNEWLWRGTTWRRGLRPRPTRFQASLMDQPDPITLDEMYTVMWSTGWSRSYWCLFFRCWCYYWCFILFVTVDVYLFFTDDAVCCCYCWCLFFLLLLSTFCCWYCRLLFAATIYFSVILLLLMCFFFLLLPSAYCRWYCYWFRIRFRFLISVFFYLFTDDDFCFFLLLPISVVWFFAGADVF